MASSENITYTTEGKPCFEGCPSCARSIPRTTPHQRRRGEDIDLLLAICPRVCLYCSPRSRPPLAFPRWLLPAQKKNLPLPHLPLTMPLPRTRPKTARSRESQSRFSDISPCSFYPSLLPRTPSSLSTFFLSPPYLNPVPPTHIRNLVPNFHVFTFHSFSKECC